MSDHARLASVGVLVHHIEDTRRDLGTDEGEEFALVRERQRVEPEHLTDALHGGAHGNGVLLEQDADARCARQLVQRCRCTTARRVAQDGDTVACRRDHCRRQVTERRTVALYLGRQGEPVARRHHGRRMVAERARDDDVHVRRDVRRRDIRPREHRPDTRRIDVDTVAAAARHDLRIARHDGDPRLLCRRRNVRHDAAQRGDGKALLKDDGK